jgi:ribosomal protein S27AE
MSTTSSGDDSVSYSQRTCKRCGARLVAVRTPRGAARWLCTACGKRRR